MEQLRRAQQTCCVVLVTECQSTRSLQLVRNDEAEISGTKLINCFIRRLHAYTVVACGSSKLYNE